MKTKGEMVEFKSKFTPEDRKVKDAHTYVREFVENAVGIVRNPDPGIIELSDVRIDYVSGTRGGYSSPWNSTTVQGILLKTNDANYRYTVRKIMVKDGKINKTDLINKYNELVELAKSAKLEQREEQERRGELALRRKQLLEEAGFQPGEYRMETQHGLASFQCQDLGRVEMELQISESKAKQILALLKE